jgi:hypothetical protein
MGSWNVLASSNDSLCVVLLFFILVMYCVRVLWLKRLANLVLFLVVLLFQSFFRIAVVLLDKFWSMKTSISTASYKIVIGNSRNCVTVPLSKFRIHLHLCCDVYFTAVQGRLRWYLIHAAKTHLRIQLWILNSDDTILFLH